MVKDSQKSEALILAAGNGTRFGELISEFNLPKPFIPIKHEQSPVEKNIRKLLAHDTRISVVMGYMFNEASSELMRIQTKIKNEGCDLLDRIDRSIISRPVEEKAYAKAMCECDVKIIYQEGFQGEEDVKKGTAVPLMLAHENDLFKDGKRVLVLMGDNLYTHGSIEDMISSKYDNNILGAHSRQPHMFGVINYNRKNNEFRGILEKPAKSKVKFLENQDGTYLVNAAMYTFTDEAIPYLDKLQPRPECGNEFLITDIVNKLARDSFVNVISTDNWVSIGTPEEYEHIRRNIL